MADKDAPITALKSRVDFLFEGCKKGNDSAVQRIRKQFPQIHLKSLTREDAMTAVARECGFKRWQMAANVFAARLNPGDDYGDFWYAVPTDVLLNVWCRNYDEARELYAKSTGFLLPYRRQFAVVQNTYIEILGMNPDDPSWKAVGFNLAIPADFSAYEKLVLQRLKTIFK